MFGLTVTSLGDIDLDGFEGIAGTVLVGLFVT